MASIGLKGFWVADYAGATKGSITFSNGKKVAKAVQFTENRTVSDVSLYGDNAKDDSAYAVTDVALGLTPTGFTLDELVDLIGRTTKNVTINGTATSVSAGTFTDESGRKAIGMYSSERSSGVVKQRVCIYPNVLFRPSDSKEKNTQGESISFATDTYTGKAFTDLSGDYIYEKEFDSEADAEAYLNGVFGATSSGSIVMDRKDAEVAVGDEITLTAAVSPAGTSVTWSSDDTDKATVSNGVVEGKAVGTVTITASITVDANTFSDSCTIRVTAGE